MSWYDRHPRLLDAVFVFDCFMIAACVCAVGAGVGYLAEWIK